MRDIREDLRERANLIEAQISAAGEDFEKSSERLQRQLKAELATLGVAMLVEEYRVFLTDFLDSDRIR